MDIQSELNWIHKELDEVKDPTLIEAFKNMLKYRKKVTNIESDYILGKVDYDMLDKRREAHLKGESKSFSWEEVKQNARRVS